MNDQTVSKTSKFGATNLKLTKPAPKPERDLVYGSFMYALAPLSSDDVVGVFDWFVEENISKPVLDKYTKQLMLTGDIQTMSLEDLDMLQFQIETILRKIGINHDTKFDEIYNAFKGIVGYIDSFIVTRRAVEKGFIYPSSEDVLFKEYGICFTDMPDLNIDSVWRLIFRLKHCSPDYLEEAFRITTKEYLIICEELKNQELDNKTVEFLTMVKHMYMNNLSETDIGIPIISTMAESILTPCLLKLYNRYEELFDARTPLPDKLDVGSDGGNINLIAILFMQSAWDIEHASMVRLDELLKHTADALYKEYTTVRHHVTQPNLDMQSVSTQAIPYKPRVSAPQTSLLYTLCEQHLDVLDVNEINEIVSHNVNPQEYRAFMRNYISSGGIGVNSRHVYVMKIYLEYALNFCYSSGRGMEDKNVIALRVAITRIDKMISVANHSTEPVVSQSFIRSFHIEFGLDLNTTRSILLNNDLPTLAGRLFKQDIREVLATDAPLQVNELGKVRKLIASEETDELVRKFLKKMLRQSEIYYNQNKQLGLELAVGWALDEKQLETFNKYVQAFEKQLPLAYSSTAVQVELNVICMLILSKVHYLDEIGYDKVMRVLEETTDVAISFLQAR